MLIIGMLAILCLLAIIGAGAVLAGLVAIAIASLVGLSVVSSSVIVGLANRSLTSAVRALLFQCCALAGAVSGIAIVALASALLAIPLELHVILLIGSIAGAASGLALALLINSAIALALRLLLKTQPRQPRGGFPIHTRNNP